VRAEQELALIKRSRSWRLASLLSRVARAAGVTR
jgi:hypothetical protein